MALADEKITGILGDLKQGRPGAEAQLMDIVYPELRRLAGSYLRRERPDHTLQPTALVNEMFLRLAGQSVDWRDRIHFFGVTAHVMRQAASRRSEAAGCSTNRSTKRA
jgi:RNA polymerase sigma-70 factor, ECF subfamily